MIFGRIEAAGETRTQLGALCWRVKQGRVRILMITSRETGRWVVPKGWPMEKLTPEAAALREAWEEAGVVGEPEPVPLGRYFYGKVVNRDAKDETIVGCNVDLFPIRVARLDRNFPEKKQRRRKWFSRRKAASLVEEPELAAMILAFDPR